MNFYISIRDLGFLLLFLIGTAVLVILCIALIRLNNLIGKINSIVDTSKSNIDKTIEQLPDTISNVNLAVTEVRDTAKRANSFIEGIGDTVSESAASIEQTYEQYIEVIKSIINIAMKIKDIIK